ncbi:MAG: glycosyltransferase family 4 protein [Clostridiales bacterium]|nr:glycosyltransferase family 4 protein [Clostridiales bacterium]
MRVGIFADTYYPQINGLATSVLMLNHYLRARGHRVFIFTTTDPDARQDEEDIYRLPSMPFLAERRMGVFYHPRLARLVRGLELDIVHTHSEFALGVFGRYMARELNLPVVHTMHTVYEDYTHYLTKWVPMLDGFTRVVARKLTAEFCNSAGQVIVPTVKMKDMLRSYGVRGEAAVIPSGIDLERFKPGYYSPEEIRRARGELGISPEDKVLLYLGRIAEEKNIQELLYGLKDYLLARQDMKFVLVGDGKDRPRLEGLTAALGMADKTIFAGVKPWDEIGKYYQIGDVFVNSSRSEAQGLTYIEAMAAGLPVAARADRCLEGILQDGVNGYAFEDQAGLVGALDKILADDAARQDLSLGAMATAEEFSAAVYADRVAAVYERLLERGRIPRRVAS